MVFIKERILVFVLTENIMSLKVYDCEKQSVGGAIIDLLVAQHITPTVLRCIYYMEIIVSSGWVLTLNLDFIADKVHSCCSNSSKYLLCLTNQHYMAQCTSVITTYINADT